MKVVAFGECMVELSRSPRCAQDWRVGFGGDSFNVAAYMARLGCAVGYLTALGTDDFSLEMRAAFRAEGVNDRLVLSHPQRQAGLYAIKLDADGERSFTYWRGESAARALFDTPGAEAALAEAAAADLLYLSGITLSLFDDAGLARVEALAAAVRAGGRQVAFDTNYRPRGWPDAARAQAVIARFARHVSVALPTFDDEAMLFGDADAERCIARWHGYGVPEIVVKLGEQGCVVAADGVQRLVPVPQRIKPVDTTGAGDSFNAGYLAARVAGHDSLMAAGQGHRLAGAVIRHPGALIDRATMPADTLAVASV